MFEEFCYEEQLNRKKDLYGMTDGKRKRNSNRKRRSPAGMTTKGQKYDVDAQWCDNQAAMRRARARNLQP